jgi:DNA-binding MarR family transcriptional regulator
LLYDITVFITGAIHDGESKEMKDPLSELPGYLLQRASSAALSELNDRLGDLNVRHADVSLLLLIQANPGITQSQAGRMLDIQRANMVPLVARLKKRGLIQSKPVDGRSRAIRLTETGRTLVEKSFAIVQAFERDLVGRVPAKLRGDIKPMLLALWQRPAQ